MRTKSEQFEMQTPTMPILFVDDEPMSHVIIRNQLKGWNLKSAYSAEEALTILNREYIPIVITDINMPGMDGIAFLQEVRKTRGMIQVVIVTASDKIDDLISAFEAGATDFLLKPLDKKLIEESLRNIMAKLSRWKGTMKALYQKRKETNPEKIFPLD
ncbi:MAG: hypothetical protein BWK80_12425 [Desulfobacteraceae bacterium IS3]|nr:MAG: hypothetical protein BWK80_12425 [Desulfobacteraceae bacterium IS3]